jgi:hypothetical protein
VRDAKDVDAMAKVTATKRTSKARIGPPWPSLAAFKDAVRHAAELEAQAALWPGEWWAEVRVERDAVSGLAAVRARERKTAKQRAARNPDDVGARFDAIQARDGMAPLSRELRADRVRAKAAAALATGYRLPHTSDDGHGFVFPMNTPTATRAYLAALNLGPEEEPSAERRPLRLVHAFASPFGDRAPRARDLGVAALLAGEWPAIDWRGATTADAIRAMTATMRELHSRAGAIVRPLERA